MVVSIGTYAYANTRKNTLVQLCTHTPCGRPPTGRVGIGRIRGGQESLSGTTNKVEAVRLQKRYYVPLLHHIGIASGR